MAYPAQRFRFRPPRGLVVLFLVLGAVIAAAFWIGPFRPVPAELQLVLADAPAGVPLVLPNTGTDQEPRYPLVLALENRGGRTARPVSVSLSVPATFRLTSDRVPLAVDGAAGNPLVRYQLPVRERKVVPGSPAEPLIGGDTLWLEPQLSDYYCTALADSVPEFVPAPAVPASELADVQVYYSFGERSYHGREAGLLSVRLDSTALNRRPAPMPPSFPTQVHEPEMPRPELGTLRSVGTRLAECGDPQQPLELYTATWETAAGGRFLVVYLNGAPRKQLFDLNRDSIIELEMWDPDSDGRFEARREASYAIPPFLLPERPRIEPVVADSLVASPGWQALFEDTARGPFRFTPDSLLPSLLKPLAAPIAPVVTTDSAAAAKLGEVAVDSAFVRRFNDVAAGPFRFAPDSLVPTALRPLRVDTAWLRKFNDVAAGPFRFSANPPPLRAQPKPQPRPRGLVPLGTPLPNYPRPGRGR